MKITFIVPGILLFLATACTQTSETSTTATETTTTETTTIETEISAEKQAEIDNTTAEIESKTEEVDSLINNL